MLNRYLKGVHNCLGLTHLPLNQRVLDGRMEGKARKRKDRGRLPSPLFHPSINSGVNLRRFALGKLLSSRLIVYHNLGLDSGPNFQGQYKVVHPDKIGGGDLGGWLCIGSVQIILESTISVRKEDSVPVCQPCFPRSIHCATSTVPIVSDYSPTSTICLTAFLLDTIIIGEFLN